MIFDSNFLVGWWKSQWTILKFVWVFLRHIEIDWLILLSIYFLLNLGHVIDEYNIRVGLWKKWKVVNSSLTCIERILVRVLIIFVLYHVTRCQKTWISRCLMLGTLTLLNLCSEETLTETQISILVLWLILRISLQCVSMLLLAAIVGIFGTQELRTKSGEIW